MAATDKQEETGYAFDESILLKHGWTKYSDPTGIPTPFWRDPLKPEHKYVSWAAYAIQVRRNELNILMNDQMTGLYEKYVVAKSDGSHMDRQGQYFVLRYDAKAENAKASRIAMWVYANNIRNSHPAQAEDIYKMLESIGINRETGMTEEEARQLAEYSEQHMEYGAPLE